MLDKVIQDTDKRPLTKLPTVGQTQTHKEIENILQKAVDYTHNTPMHTGYDFHNNKINIQFIMQHSPIEQTKHVQTKPIS